MEKYLVTSFLLAAHLAVFVWHYWDNKFWYIAFLLGCYGFSVGVLLTQ